MSPQEEKMMPKIVRYLNGEATVAERQQVDTWIASSSENKKYLEELKSTWEHTDSIKDFDAIDVDQQWNMFKEKTGIETAKTPVFSLTKLWKVAAAILVLIAGTWYMSQSFNNQIILIAESGQENRFELPDGSVVWLNTNSELSYSKDFGGEKGKVRALNLEGEAYFEVAKNPKKPFEVTVNDTKTQVLGTSFNLRENLDTKSVSLVLVTGKVAFSNATTKEIVHPGEQVESNADGSLIKTKTVGQNFLAWKTGVLVFENSTLEDALQDIADFYQIRVDAVEEQLKHCTLTIKFQKEPIEVVLETLKTLYNVTYRKDASGNYQLTGGGC